MMITLEGNSLSFRFPEVHENAKTEIQFSGHCGYLTTANVTRFHRGSVLFRCGISKASSTAHLRAGANVAA